MNKKTVYRLTLLPILLLLLTNTALAQSPENGETAFQQKCAACHTVGKGPLVGPDLKGVTTTRDHAWLVRWIMTPDKMIAEGDPIAKESLAKWNNIAMVNLGVTEAEAKDMIAYIEAQSGGATEAAAPAPTAPPVIHGDAVLGWSLFTGRTSLQNGGPACLSCHVIGNTGELGGGTLGLDLTQVYVKYGGDTGVASTLASLPFPTMKPIFDKHPLTPEEQAHLQAFFKTVPTDQAPPQPELILSLMTLGGVVVLLGLTQFIWRKRLNGVREKLVG